MVEFIPRRPGATLREFGYLADWLSDCDPRPASEQLGSRYCTGGWEPFSGFKLSPNESLLYPGDPPTRPIAELRIRDERVVLYDSAWIAIIQKDGTFECMRMD